MGIPIQKLISQRRINDVRFGGSPETAYWSEVIDAKGVIRRQDFQSSQSSVSGDLDVQGLIGYGGGEFDLKDHILVMVGRSGKLGFIDLESQSGLQSLNLKWNHLASPAISDDGNRILFIAGNGEDDCIALAELSREKQPVPVIHGADFYMSPVWHPQGERVAWAEWSHPFMSWDASCIKTGKVPKGCDSIEDINWIAGSPGGAASQPQFSPCGKFLSYIIRNGEWDDLMVCDLESKESRVLVKGDDFHLGLPAWVQGMHSYGWNQQSTCIYHLRYLRGRSQLWRVSINSDFSERIEISPFTWATQLSVSRNNDQIALIGSSPDHPRQIAVLSTIPDNQFIEPPYRFEESSALPFKEISYLCAHGYPVYGWLYEPANLEPDAPLIIHIHGGPTTVEPLSFSIDAMFFTSRGYRFAEVNYRGSSTFGYRYQDALRQAWGIVDSEDVIGLLDKLIQTHDVNPDKIVLMGSSAGGFTLLNCLIDYPDRFQAAVCSYAVSDLVADARDTHKMERYYHQFLTGDLKKDMDRFVNRSPINRIDRIQTPLLLFHGGNDPVVSVSQSRMMFQKLLQNGVSCELVVYPEEGHGFRKNANVEDYYQTVETFLKSSLHRD